MVDFMFGINKVENENVKLTIIKNRVKTMVVKLVRCGDEYYWVYRANEMKFINALTFKEHLVPFPKKLEPTLVVEEMQWLDYLATKIKEINIDAVCILADFRNSNYFQYLTDKIKA